MKTLSILLITSTFFLAASIFYSSKASSRTDNNSSSHVKSTDVPTNPVIPPSQVMIRKREKNSCLLPELEQTLRITAIKSSLGPLIKEVKEVESGYVFRFDATDEVLDTVHRWMKAESKCCGFMQFQVTLEKNQGPLWFQITGEDGTKELIESVLDVKG